MDDLDPTQERPRSASRRSTPPRRRGLRLVATLAIVLLLLVPDPGTAAMRDRDADGLRDAFETRWGVTDPGDWDSDDDGVIDAAEDSDGDRLGNLGEQRFGTQPGRRDSDRDGRRDGAEDADGDGRSNAREQDQRPLPPGLRPALAHARRDLAPYKARCGVAPGGSRVNRCVFGDRESRTVVVLMGDSHAQQLTPAARRAAEAEGWKLVTLIKGACPPIVGVRVPGQVEIDGGRSCEAWRQGALRWLRGHPPTLIVVAHSDSYALVDDAGRTLPISARLLAWRRGLSRTLSAMPARSDVLVLGDTPHNADDPVSCLSRHPRDMSACVSRRVGPRGRTVERALRDVTLQHGEQHRSLYGKVCTYDPCPLVQGDVLIYRDRTHLTATFSRRIWPSVRTLIANALRS
jgi:hypothetical protein